MGDGGCAGAHLEDLIDALAGRLAPLVVERSPAAGAQSRGLEGGGKVSVAHAELETTVALRLVVD